MCIRDRWLACSNRRQTPGLGSSTPTLGDSRGEESVKLFKALRQCGLDTSCELRSVLRPHPSVENRTTELPWWMDSRFVCLNGAQPIWAKAKCVRARRFHFEATLPLATALLDVDSLRPNEDLRCEQQSRDSFFKAARLAAFFDPIQLLDGYGRHRAC